MANFSATVNAGAAYLVNDIYKKHINPEADNRKLVRFSYLGSVLILAMGILLGMKREDTSWLPKARSELVMFPMCCLAVVG